MSHVASSGSPAEATSTSPSWDSPTEETPPSTSVRGRRGGSRTSTTCAEASTRCFAWSTPPPALDYCAVSPSAPTGTGVLPTGDRLLSASTRQTLIAYDPSVRCFSDRG